MNPWNILLIQPLTTILLFFYNLFGRNLGLAIIALTVVLRILLFPLSLPAFRSVKAQRELKPKLDKLKKKYKSDRQKLSQAQLELFRQAGVNPFAGCLPQLLQLLVLIALYQVFIGFLTKGELNTQFLVWNLAQRDPYLILPLLAAAAQFLLSRMVLPAVSEEESAVKATKKQTDDLATSMQKQNLYLFPLLTVVFGLQLPSGLMLYWFVASLLQFAQQWWVGASNSIGKANR
ncbi:hypothetical protein COY35_01585 [candidate division WWE3 bacterium CG_4_10_14_0_2_um_filter_47_8]|nr:MAG: hypothetical protein COY35_01585 [candidate division WWE3 bacterium CG_4_10_14_0_2_um_filter_47_8]